MGFLSSIRLRAVILDTATRVFQSERVIPNGAERFRCYYSLYIVAMFLHAESGKDIDEISSAIAGQVKDLRINVSDLVHQCDPARMILKASHPADLEKIVTGHEAMMVALDSTGQIHLNSLLSKTQGPFGIPAGAAMFVHESIFGVEREPANFLQLTDIMMRYVRGVS